MIELRPAVADDAEVVARIYIDSWNEGFGHLLGVRHHEPAQVGRWRTDLSAEASRWTVATIDGEVVGFVGVCASRDPVDPQLGELETIAVDPVHWRRRVGRALMAHAENQLRQRWAQAILWTPAGYARGHAFYLAMGWRPLSQERRAGTEVAFGRTL